MPNKGAETHEKEEVFSDSKKKIVVFFHKNKTILFFSNVEEIVDVAL